MIYLEEILKLSATERILLLEKIWNSLNKEDISIPDSHIAETRRRLERIKSGEAKFSSWEEVKERLHANL